MSIEEDKIAKSDEIAASSGTEEQEDYLNQQLRWAMMSEYCYPISPTALYLMAESFKKQNVEAETKLPLGERIRKFIFGFPGFLR